MCRCCWAFASQSKRFLLLLDLVSLRLGRLPILSLQLPPFGFEAPVDLLLYVVAAASGLVHETPVVAFFKRGNDVLTS